MALLVGGFGLPGCGGREPMPVEGTGSALRFRRIGMDVLSGPCRIRADGAPCENDYNLLVHNLNELAKTISGLRDDVERRRLMEARESLEPNQADWVNLIGVELRLVAHVFTGLQDGVPQVSAGRPGETVFREQPPSAPETP
jgi:hypothetical protein